MKQSFKKLSIKTPTPKTGSGKFVTSSSPKTSSLKTYTKEALKFGPIGFGNTGLNEMPSLLGMKKTAGL